MSVKNKQSSLTTVEDLKNFLFEYFKNKQVKIWYFGSRARGDNTSCSDVDIAIDGENIEYDLILIKDYLEESTLPYKVDIINFKEAPQKLRREIEKEGILWKKE